MTPRATRVVASAAAAIVMSAAAAHATPIAGSLQLRLIESVGGTSVTITDQGACVGSCIGWTADINATLGVVTASGPLGAFIVNVSTGMGFPFVDGGLQGSLDFNSVNATSAAGGGTLTIQATQTGFSTLFPDFQLSASGTLAGSGSGASVTTTASGTNNNTAFSTSYSIVSLGPFTGAAFSNTLTGPAFTPGANPYSLTVTTALTASATGVTTYSGSAHVLGVPESTTVVPEPATLMLCGAGLAVLAARRQKRRA